MAVVEAISRLDSGGCLVLVIILNLHYNAHLTVYEVNYTKLTPYGVALLYPAPIDDLRRLNQPLLALRTLATISGEH